ncbi:MAG: helix-turn-helix transcriptional regulator [Phycisphaerae bacterium]|nr:helix-turn-helix transcriptional regulator [Phycisphaerae bacterium]
MTNAPESGGISRDRITRLQRACAAADRLAEVPLVPSDRWCERVCDALSSGIPGAAALALTGLIDATGRVDEIELAGARAADTAGPPHDLGARLRAVRSLGVRVDGRWPRVVPLTAPTSPGVSLAGLTQGLATAGPWRRTGPAPASSRTGAVAIWNVGKRQIALALHAEEPGEAAELLWVLMPAIARRAAMSLGPGLLRRRQMLTALEERVMQLLAAGLGVPEIAAGLSRSRHTIHDHVKSLHRKMSINSRAELVARALGRMPIFLHDDQSPHGHAAGERDSGRNGERDDDDQGEPAPASTASVVD